MIRYVDKKLAIYFLLICALAFSSTTACASTGGKGIQNARSRALSYLDEMTDNVEGSAEQPAESNFQMDSDGAFNLEASRTGTPTNLNALDAQDPFGLIPEDWPEDIEIHPDGKVAQRRGLASNGYFLLILIPSSKATIMGVQTFHLDNLSAWQSLEVEEAPIENSDISTLTIIGEREGAWLKITAQESTPAELATLENYEFWQNLVGSDPLIVRFYYAPISPRL